MTQAMTIRQNSSGQARTSVAVWSGCVTAAAVLTSFTFACIAPFAALGAICALRLERGRNAAYLIGGAWLANQIVGYGVLGYPRDASSFAWGGVLLAAALAAAGSARIVARPGPGHERRTGRILRAGLAVAAAYVAVQAVIFLGGVVLHGDAFSLQVQRELIVVNAATFAAVLVAGHAGNALLAAALRRRSPQPAANRQVGGFAV